METKTTNNVKHDPICDEWSDGSICFCMLILATRFDERQRAVKRIEDLTWQAMTWHNISKAILNRATVKMRGRQA